MGKSTINGAIYTMAMLNYQRVDVESKKAGFMLMKHMDLHSFFSRCPLVIYFERSELENHHV